MTLTSLVEYHYPIPVSDRTLDHHSFIHILYYTILYSNIYRGHARGRVALAYVVPLPFDTYTYVTLYLWDCGIVGL